MLIFKELRGHGNRYREIKGPMWHRAVNYRIEHRPHDVSGLSGLPGLFVVCLHGDTPTTYAYTRKHKGDATRRIQRGPRHQDSDPNYERRGKGDTVTRNFDTLLTLLLCPPPFSFLEPDLMWLFVKHFIHCVSFRFDIFKIIWNESTFIFLSRSVLLMGYKFRRIILDKFVLIESVE